MTYHLVQRKRDGEELTPDEIRAFFEAYGREQVPEYLMAAFLMAVFFRGLSASELNALVDAMLDSGMVVDLSAISGVKVDKHSTGGVGDKVSLVLAPLVASLGAVVPMMSGRGLAHTGGTVDKLESIPGFRTGLTLEQYRDQLERIGCALIAQTEQVAPLDRRLYALRDVTGTVEAIPLIASSIMSKKLAEGIDALVLDIKEGGGAFLPERARAEQLARTMIAIGRERGCDVVALMTAMDRPLGHAVGNALEVEEALLALRDEGPEDLKRVTLALAAEMLVLAGIAPDRVEGMRLADAALGDGRALEKMREVITAQGGNPCVVDDPSLLPRASVQWPVEAEESGCVTEMDVRAIGRAAVDLGAGRTLLGATIDPAVGFRITVKPGDQVQARDRLATVYSADVASAEVAAARLRAAIRLGEARTALPLVSRRITAKGIEELVS